MKSKTWQAAMVGVLVVVLALMLLLGSPRPTEVAAQTDITQGTLQVKVEPGEKLLEFPLEHTDVKAEISGMVAGVTVTQTFSNPYEDTIEAIYVFPLPQNAAVSDMTMKIGDRTIRGLIKRREEAKEIYEQAKEEGKVASLLEQERPNIFTQSVANITPGAKILIEIRYDQDLKYDDGTYEFTFPMVVGPRFIPGTPTGRQGGGWAPDTDQVPDASRITPPVLKPEERSGHDISLSVSLDAGVPIQNLRCRSHEVDVEREGESEATIALKPFDTIPNKDFMLAYDVAGEEPEMALMAHRDTRGGFFTLMIQPKAEFDVEEITPKEMIFVVDCSGSMSGEPISKAKQAMRQCITHMNPDDTFRVIRFSEAASQLSQEPLTNTPENVKRGLHYIEQMEGSGGTMMIEGIKAALDYPRDGKRVRIVSFMTDGYIGNETEILAAVEEKIGDARLFSFGVGTSVNRYLLERMAEAGRGVVQYVRPNEDTTEVVERFYDRIARPYLLDLRIDWRGLKVADVYPEKIPDLFASQPVILHGRYTEPGEGTVKVNAILASQPWSQELEVKLPEKELANEALSSLWARARIKELMDSMYQGEDEETVEQVTDLALEFRLMSAYTSFVAVEEKVVREGGEVKSVQVPVPMPEGVSYEGVFGPADEMEAASATVHAWTAYRVAAPAGPRGPRGETEYLRNEVYDLGDRIGWLVGQFAGGPVWLTRGIHSGEGAEGNARALVKLLGAASEVIGLPAGGLDPRGVGLAALSELPEDSKLRCLYITGKGALSLTEDESGGLAAFVNAGGFLIFDAADEPFAESVAGIMAAAVPGAQVRDLPADHSIFTAEGTVYDIPDGNLKGIYVGDELIGVVSSENLGTAWSAERDEQTEMACRLGINLVSYVLRR
jgi:Ca-activated chloride channel family protein